MKSLVESVGVCVSSTEIFPFYFIQIFLQNEIKTDLWRYQSDIKGEKK